jgi:dihydroxy-acid dehydratase
VREGDEIALAARGGRLDLLVDAAELERRRASWAPPEPPARGRRRIHALGVLQANLGADLDVLPPGVP